MLEATIFSDIWFWEEIYDRGVQTVTAIMTVAAVIFAALATRAASRAVEVSNEALQFAKTANEIGSRAYLNFSWVPSRMLGFDGVPHGVRFTLKIHNAGLTPASDVHVLISGFANREGAPFGLNSLTYSVRDIEPILSQAENDENTVSYDFDYFSRAVADGREVFLCAAVQYRTVYAVNKINTISLLIKVRGKSGIDLREEVLKGIPVNQVVEFETAYDEGISDALKSMNFKHMLAERRSSVVN